MNSITACDTTDTLMASFSARGSAERLRKKHWKAEGAAYALALLAHLAAWHLYRAMPVPPPPEEPPIIEAVLMVAQPAPAAAVAAPPQPQLQPPPPLPKPIPKVEKPVPKKLEPPKPKPEIKPIPKPKPKPQKTEADTKPAPVQEASPAPEPPAPAPVAAETPRAVPKAAAPAPVENAEYHSSSVSGFPRNNYPSAARAMRLEGVVRMKIHILANGEIGEVIVVSSSGHAILDEAAVSMAKEAHATPARRGDKPIDEWRTLPYRFHLDD